MAQRVTVRQRSCFEVDKTSAYKSDVAKTTGGNVDFFQDDGRLLIEIHGKSWRLVHNLSGKYTWGQLTI